jgi:PAS domain S-box-containing protein
VLQRIHPDDRAMIRQLLDETSSGEKDFDVTHRLLMPDGSVKFVHVLSHALKDAAGNLEIVGALMDVTENTLLYRDRAEREARLVERTKALRRSEAYLAEAERLSHTGILVLNATTWQFVYLSDESYRIWGLDSMQGLPSLETIRQRFHPDDRDRVWQKVQEALRQKKDYSGELRIVLPNGTVKYLAVNAHHLFSTNGELVEVIATCADVTDHKRAEQALRENEGKFRDYAETASDWFWEIGPDYKFTMLTENAFGSHAADRIGTACWDHALVLETEPEKWRLVWATLDSRQSFRDFVYCSLGGDGAPMYVKASGKPIFDSNGEFRGYRGTGTDVTALMRAQEEHERLHQLESDIAHMNRLSMMGELAASLAHEIAQPIATARNNARASMNFLDRSPPDLGQVREALTCVVDDADRAGDILDRIRDHIKKAPPRKERVDLNQAITDVIALAQGAILKNCVSIQTRLTEGLSDVQADRVQLQQVVLNLILNAVEALGSIEEGVRELSITTKQHEAAGVLVTVHDSGPGIDPEHLDRVFDAFYTTKSSGVGMGLSICRSIIDAHGGRLWADVNTPRGAVFRFTLPGAEKELTNSLRPTHLTREPHEDTVSDAAHRPAYEGNKRPHR